MRWVSEPPGKVKSELHPSHSLPLLQTVKNDSANKDTFRYVSVAKSVIIHRQICPTGDNNKVEPHQHCILPAHWCICFPQAIIFRMQVDTVADTHTHTYIYIYIMRRDCAGMSMGLQNDVFALYTIKAVHIIRCKSVRQRLTVELTLINHLTLHVTEHVSNVTLHVDKLEIRNIYVSLYQLPCVGFNQ